jgi:cytochrome b6-f complex iron-sulfur subunit
VLSSWSVLGIIVAAAVAVAGLVAVVVLYRTRRSPRNDETGAAPDQARRQLVQRGMIALFVAALAGVVASAVDYVWPSVTGTTGGRFRVGSRQAVNSRIAAQGGKPYYDVSGRFYLAEYPAQDLSAAKKVYPVAQLEAMELGIIALSQKCPHLGCTVKWCKSSGWFECPCHGSRYNAVGELERGPAPRGLDRFAVQVVAGELEVDTSTTYLGPPPGTRTTDQPAKGPHCY